MGRMVASTVILETGTLPDYGVRSGSKLPPEIGRLRLTSASGRSRAITEAIGLLRRAKARIPPVFRVRTGFVVPGVLQMDFFISSGWKLVRFLCFNFPKAAVLVGVGHWLHDTPPIFSNRIMRCAGVRSCVGNRTVYGCGGASARLLRVKRGLFSLQIGDQLSGPVDRERIAYREQYSAIPLNGFVDLDALLAHGSPPLIRREATRPPVIL